MNKQQQVLDFIIKHKDEIKTIGGLGLAFTCGAITKKTIDQWKGFRLVKLLKGTEDHTVVANIEVLLTQADIPYNFLYDPDHKQYYLTIN